MTLLRPVPPTTEAVSLAECKAQCRLEASDTEHDTMLEIYRQKARLYFEGQTGRTVHLTTWEITLDCWPGCRYITLPRATPLVDIVSVTLTDSEGNPTVWTSSEYIADVDSTPGRLVLGYGESWPSFTPYPVSPIRIRYRAGIQVTSPFTEAGADVKVPVLMLVSGMFENRESENIEIGSIQRIAAEYGVESFINDMRVEYAF